MVTDITNSAAYVLGSETINWFISVQDISNVVRPLEGDSELRNSLREVSISARLTMKYPSRLMATYMCKDLWGVSPRVHPVRCPPGRGPRGAHVSGGGAVRGREARGACTFGEGHEGDRGGPVAVRTPRKGPSSLPVPTGRFVAHHPTQQPTRLT